MSRARSTTGLLFIICSLSPLSRLFVFLRPRLSRNSRVACFAEETVPESLDLKVQKLSLVDAAAADELLQMMRDNSIVPLQESYNAIIIAMARKDRCRRISAWIEDMKKEGITPTAKSLEEALKSFARRNELVEAEKTYRTMCQAFVSPSTPSIFTSLIAASSAAGKYAKAKMWFDQLKECGLKPNLITFNAVLDAAARLGNIEEAEGWMSAITTSGFKPDKVSWGALINAYATAGDPSGAELAFRRASGAQVGSTGWLPPGRGCGPELYRSVAKAFARSGDLAGTEQWIAEMSDRGLEPGLIGYSIVLGVCAAQAQMQRVDYWLQVIAQRGLAPDHQVFGSVLAGLVQGSHVAEAVSWLDEMTRRGAKPSASDYALALRACSQVEPKATALAEDILKRMFSAKVTVDVEVKKSLNQVVGADHASALLRNIASLEPAKANSRRKLRK